MGPYQIHHILHFSIILALPLLKYSAQLVDYHWSQTREQWIDIGTCLLIILLHNMISCIEQTQQKLDDQSLVHCQSGSGLDCWDLFGWRFFSVSHPRRTNNIIIITSWLTGHIFHWVGKKKNDIEWDGHHNKKKTYYMRIDGCLQQWTQGHNHWIVIWQHQQISTCHGHQFIQSATMSGFIHLLHGCVSGGKGGTMAPEHRHQHLQIGLPSQCWLVMDQSFIDEADHWQV